MSIEVGNNCKAQSVTYKEGISLCCRKVSANLYIIWSYVKYQGIEKVK